MRTELIRLASNRKVVDFRKVVYANFYWRSGTYHRELKPRNPTVRGVEIVPNEFASPHHDYPCETLLERARRLQILDIWIPVCVFIMTNGHRLEYTGNKAKELWKTYNTKVFGQERKEQRLAAEAYKDGRDYGSRMLSAREEELKALQTGETVRRNAAITEMVKACAQMQEACARLVISIQK